MTAVNDANSIQRRLLVRVTNTENPNNYSHNLYRLFVLLNTSSLIISILVLLFNIFASKSCSNLTALIGNNSFCYGSGSFVFLGFLGILLVTIGFWFFFSDEPLLLIGYFTGTLIVACLSLAGCTIALYLKIQIIPVVKFRMQESLLQTYGTSLYPQTTEAWDRLQTENLCCGVSNGDAEALYANSTWFRLHTIYPLQRVPSSCCLSCSAMITKLCAPNSSVNKWIYSIAQQRCESIKKICQQSHMKYINYAACQRRRFSAVATEDDNFLYYEGCLKPLQWQLTVFIYKLFLSGTLMALVFFACFFVSCVFLNRTTPVEEPLL